VQQGRRSKDVVQLGQRSKDIAQQELTTIHAHVACNQNVFEVHQDVPVNMHNPHATTHT
jgi:hypothetical protein